MARMRHITDSANVVGEAVLCNFPIRLWLQQQEHTEGIVREFQLLRGGHEDGLTSSPPQVLMDVLGLFDTHFGPLLDEVRAARRRAVEAGLDRIDSRVPLLHRTPDLLDEVRQVMDAVDEHCARGELLSMPRRRELVAFSDWTLSELSAQYYGAAPTPWAGPF